MIIAPDAEVIILPSKAFAKGQIEDETKNHDTFFAVAESAYKRTRRSTAFSSLIEGYQLADPILQRMSALLTAIEIASWSIDSSSQTGTNDGLVRRGKKDS